MSILQETVEVEEIGGKELVQEHEGEKEKRKKDKTGAVRSSVRHRCWQRETES